MGAKAEECRLCGARDVVPYDDLDEASPSKATKPAQVVPEDVALTPAQLDTLASDLVGWIELSPEGRKFLYTHVATERNAKNREFVLRLRGKKFTCDGCGVDLAEEYSAQHGRVVEVHHVRPLARGPQQAKGTADFNVLCPTCHRVVHYRREEPLRIEELRRLLGSPK
jgi:predicted HNH restriction endonuclease